MTAHGHYSLRDLAAPRRRWLSFIVLLGALFGLLGQEMAVAQAIPLQSDAVAMMSDDCAEKMEQAKQPTRHPLHCEGKTPDCMARMGCAVPLALLPPHSTGAAPEMRPRLPDLVPASPLIGRKFGPEPEPPVRLG